MPYTTAKRVSVIALFFGNDQNANRTSILFNEQNPGKHLSRNHFLDLVKKIRETGSVLNKNRNVQRMVVNDNNAIGVIGQVIANPRLSPRGLSAMAGISHVSAWRILKNHKCHPYKFQLVHELNEDDFDRRQEFCEGMSERLMQNPELLYNICFYLNGCVNGHNCRYWADENPKQYAEIHTQHTQKLNVWTGILGNHIIGPFFIDGNLTGDSYLQLLEEAIQPRIVEIIEQDPRCQDEFIHFQQDGALLIMPSMFEIF